MAEKPRFDWNQKTEKQVKIDKLTAKENVLQSALDELESLMKENIPDLPRDEELRSRRFRQNETYDVSFEQMWNVKFQKAKLTRTDREIPCQNSREYRYWRTMEIYEAKSRRSKEGLYKMFDGRKRAQDRHKIPQFTNFRDEALATRDRMGLDKHTLEDIKLPPPLSPTKFYGEEFPIEGQLLSANPSYFQSVPVYSYLECFLYSLHGKVTAAMAAKRSLNPTGGVQQNQDLDLVEEMGIMDAKGLSLDLSSLLQEEEDGEEEISKENVDSDTSGSEKTPEVEPEQEKFPYPLMRKITVRAELPFSVFSLLVQKLVTAKDRDELRVYNCRNTRTLKLMRLSCVKSMFVEAGVPKSGLCSNTVGQHDYYLAVNAHFPLCVKHQGKWDSNNLRCDVRFAYGRNL